MGGCEVTHTEQQNVSSGHAHPSKQATLDEYTFLHMHAASTLIAAPELRVPALWQGMVAAWESVRGPLDQYGMQHTRAFANLCNSGVTPCAFKASVCKTSPKAAAINKPRATITMEEVISNSPGMVIRAPEEKGGLPIMSFEHPWALQRLSKRLSKSIAKGIKSAVRRPHPPCNSFHWPGCVGQDSHEWVLGKLIHDH